MKNKIIISISLVLAFAISGCKGGGGETHTYDFIFKNSPKITKKWYHVGISKEFPLISVVSCWYFKDSDGGRI